MKPTELKSFPSGLAVLGCALSAVCNVSPICFSWVLAIVGCLAVCPYDPLTLPAGLTYPLYKFGLTQILGPNLTFIKNKQKTPSRGSG